MALVGLVAGRDDKSGDAHEWNDKGWGGDGRTAASQRMTARKARARRETAAKKKQIPAG